MGYSMQQENEDQLLSALKFGFTHLGQPNSDSPASEIESDSPNNLKLHHLKTYRKIRMIHLSFKGPFPLKYSENS